MISAWSSKGKVFASYRDEFRNLFERPIGNADYAAYVRDPKILAGDHSVISRAEDFPGWWKLLFIDYDSRKLALEHNPGVLYEADVSPVRRFLTDHDCKIDAPKRGFWDLETDSRVPFSEAIQGRSRLLSFAVVGSGKRAVCVLADDDDQAEAELWSEFWNTVADYDQLAAWNSEKFDDLVRDERCNYLARKFPKLFGPYWENKRRLLWIDQLACFKRHHMAMESGEDKTSNKLGDVCQALIGEGKDDFDSSKTWEAWLHDRQRLAKYNLQDTALLEKLEAETGYLTLQQTIADVTLTFANSHGLKPMPWVDGYLLKAAHKRQTHLPSKKQPTGAEVQYEGAFVMPPAALGIHRTVHVCDFKSLYPTVIRTWNMGHEAKGHEGCTAFGTGVTFATEVETMLAQAAREFMELRDYWKKEYAKDPNNKEGERKSKAYKIANNSIYGVIGSPWSRFYDTQIAESITLNAQHLIKETIKLAETKGMVALYGDTDSLFVTGCTIEEFEAFKGECNEELYPSLLLEASCNPAHWCIELAYEKAFDRCVFPLGVKGSPSAKRYIGSFLHYGGKPKSKPEIRGLEYMRGDSIRTARTMQRECIDRLLKGRDDPDSYEEWIRSERERIMKGGLPLEEVALTRGLSRDIDKSGSEGGYKGNPAHVAVARLMAERGEEVSEGTRIAYVIVDGSKSPVKTIPASDYQGKYDARYYWNKQIYPPTLRLLAGAFPSRNWKRWMASRAPKVLPGQTSLFG